MTDRVDRHPSAPSTIIARDGEPFASGVVNPDWLTVDATGAIVPFRSARPAGDQAEPVDHWPLAPDPQEEEDW